MDTDPQPASATTSSASASRRIPSAELFATHEPLHREVPRHYQWTFIKTAEQVLQDYVSAHDEGHEVRQTEAVLRFLAIPRVLLAKPSTRPVQAPLRLSDLNLLQDIRRAEAALQDELDSLADNLGWPSDQVSCDGATDRSTSEVRSDRDTARPFCASSIPFSSTSPSFSVSSHPPPPPPPPFLAAAAAAATVFDVEDDARGSGSHYGGSGARHWLHSNGQHRAADAGAVVSVRAAARIAGGCRLIVCR